MKIAIIGASGFAGNPILQEALARGHQVTAIVRNPSKVAAHKNVKAVQGDIQDAAKLAKLLEGHDVVISSVHFTQTDAPKLIQSVKSSHVLRYLVVGGAGSLEVAPGVTLVSTPEFPAIYKDEAMAGSKFLDTLRKEKELKWTFVSPSAFFTPESKTGKFRLGKDQLLTDAKGESRISVQDFAIAMLDEVEKPKHANQRFTVGY